VKSTVSHRCETCQKTPIFDSMWKKFRIRYASFRYETKNERRTILIEYQLLNNMHEEHTPPPPPSIPTWLHSIGNYGTVKHTSSTILFEQILINCFNQCCGAATFWCRSGSGSALLIWCRSGSGSRIRVQGQPWSPQFLLSNTFFLELIFKKHIYIWNNSIDSLILLNYQWKVASSR
jgi:hypothetical protein